MLNDIRFQKFQGPCLQDKKSSLEWPKPPAARPARAIGAPV